MAKALRITLKIALSMGLLVGCWLGAREVSAAEFMFRATVGSETFEGKPLQWTSSQMVLLARDGQLHYFDPRQAEDAKKTAPRFQGFSATEMRAELRREYGNRFQVDSTGHYLVVHPPGRGDEWGKRFEQLFRSFHGYFRVRGFELNKVEFPLVAIVFPSRAEYYQQAKLSGVRLLPGTLGHYDLRTNRVLMYDPGGTGASDWEEAAATLVHEATHQTAYNVGLHSRTAITPRWLVEGLAMMFEAPGVYRSEAFGGRSNRINHGRLRDFQKFLQSQSKSKKQSQSKQAQGNSTSKKPSGKQAILELVASDQLFARDTIRAYANAWALSFYLSETHPRQYERYLTLTAGRPSTAKYSPADRVRDFCTVFGNDLDQLGNHFLQWTSELR